jgi:hypothetical protein
MAVFPGFVFLKKSEFNTRQAEGRLVLLDGFIFNRDAGFALESFHQRRLAGLSHSVVFIPGDLALVPDGMQKLRKKVNHAAGRDAGAIPPIRLRHMREM